MALLFDRATVVFEFTRCVSRALEEPTSEIDTRSGE
jgi:hypothetical protein